MTERAEAEIPTFGTVKGVLVPTLLTILGVIMYLRLGWVVGNVGLLGAWSIILIAFGITTATALSISSIVSNVRIGAGGAYAIITRSLGLEIGGSIGVPLYLSLALSMALYIFGFREGLRYLFPEVSALVVDFTVFAVLFIIVFISTEIAFRVQYGVLAVIIASLLSIAAAGLPAVPELAFTRPTPPLSFWVVFAVFFPAATGIMAGANMSGELKNPRQSIPFGTLAAIAVSLAVYLALAGWLAGSASPEDLASDFTILIRTSAFGLLVLAGLLAATFSSALNSLVGASRVLHAMGEHDILPGSAWITRRSAAGVPRNALLVTALIVVAALLLRDLNAIAPLITMFFLITYAMINIVILVEQSLGLVSFRPRLTIPRAVPLAGAAGCLFAMFVINPLFSLFAVVLVGAFYAVLIQRHLKETPPYGDVRSSLFVALAEWAAKKAQTLPSSQERAWRPNLLVPVDNPTEFRGVSAFARDITYPSGSVSILGVHTGGEDRDLAVRIPYLAEDFRQDGIFTSWTIVRAATFAVGVTTSMQALKRTIFPPNIVFLRMPDSAEREEETVTIIRRAAESRMAGVLYAAHPKAGLGRRRQINLWIPEACMAWTLGKKLPNCDLAILIAYKLVINWDAAVTVIAAVEDPERAPAVRESLETLLEQARLPHTDLLVMNDRFDAALGSEPQADLNIFSLTLDPDFAAIRTIVEKTRSTCLFCRDSTRESALV
ncbi:Na-K-Cl cotransporter [Methanoculleus sp. FWC-SCC1]|uniref:Na-K-Cl cotransporter n=1 Tax=Methanoculleus frigidifontis TaxID=2584085 RepID=A0ABT8M6X2_9EURY|nr:amino acid permease [Methanoculleus sp. FWC-SCC1]MDN7023684.1 Na-K-Cl cotransporter [Methanoculleus sp. FWC-SCC1]